MIGLELTSNATTVLYCGGWNGPRVLKWLGCIARSYLFFLSPKHVFVLFCHICFVTFVLSHLFCHICFVTFVLSHLSNLEAMTHCWYFSASANISSIALQVPLSTQEEQCQWGPSTDASFLGEAQRNITLRPVNKYFSMCLSLVPSR
jgi:hypothetical protein